MWNPDTYDEWYKTFQGAVENYVDWELLKKHLPKNKNAKTLDAAGGTGRITLPLAKMGYSLTLCDISSEMLDVAKQKMIKGGVSDKVKILECDVRSLRFADESFDFVLCWDGAFEATKELIRVTKKGGRISIFLHSKWESAVNNFYKNPDSTLTLIESSPSYLEDEEGKHRVVSTEEARELFEAEGIRVIDIYAVCGWTDVLRIPEKVRKSRDWDEKFFKQTTQMALKLSKEPSVKGMTRHLVVYGEKT
ncbi:MAG: class I SAM-dependent methyltransferase [candidate division Zixibacteria bacterium]|nr:class I SAM-dependent methyltransferase [candidate division Zixibacteria bacterium]